MPAFILEDDTLHVQPLHSPSSWAVQLYQRLGHGFFPDARAATARLEMPEGRGFEPTGPIVSVPESHEDRLALTHYRFALNDIRKVTAGDRFPDLTIEVRGPSYYRETYDLTPMLPRFFVGPASEEAHAYGRGVADLFDAAMKNEWRGEWIAGWLDASPIDWEPVDDFPGDTEASPGYRTSPLQGSRIVAERDPGGLFERLVRSFLPRGKRSPSRVLLTQDEVYAEFDGQVFVLPRGLPIRELGDGLVFGRFAGMVLEPRDAPCPVATALRAEAK